MLPKQFRLTKPQYQLFDLTVFRKHMDQCKQAQKEYAQTPGQVKSNKFKVGGDNFKRTAN